MRFEVLGPAAIISGGESTVLPSTKPSAVLASLLVKPNDYVSLDYLKYALWGETPPRNADVTLPTYILRLRRLLRKHSPGPDPIHTMSRGYRISLPKGHESLDLLAFERLLDRARGYRNSGELENERSTLQWAAELWKGPALSNIPSDALHREETPRLNERWFDVLERRFSIDLALGELDDLVPRLRQAIAQRPERERLWEQLIEALYRSGRSSEALDEYQRVHAYMTADLGIEPRTSLQELQMTVLRQEPLPATADGAGPSRARLKAADAPAVVDPSEVRRPHARLPLNPRFIGRKEETASMVESVSGQHTPVTLITGPPDVGKSAIALQVAAECAPRFRGGVLTADLSSPDGRRRRPAQVLSDLLEQAGCRISGGEGESRLLSVWRSVTADRPCLVVLDGADGSSCHASLLPRSPACHTIVTSRYSLAHLVAFHDARPYLLPPLDQAHSVHLLKQVIGTPAEQVEARHLKRVANACGGMPGLLRRAGAKFLTGPYLGMERFAELFDTTPLDQLALVSEPGESPRDSIREAFSRVSPQAQELFLDVAGLGQGDNSAGRILTESAGGPTGADRALDELYAASLVHHCGDDKISVFRPQLAFAAETVRERAGSTNQECAT